MSALTSTQIFQICSAAGNGSNQTAFLMCVTDQLLLQDKADRQFSRTIYLIYSAALIFFMQAGKSHNPRSRKVYVKHPNITLPSLCQGFAMLCAGAVRRKNVQNTMLKNLLDAVSVSLVDLETSKFCIFLLFSFSQHSAVRRIVCLLCLWLRICVWGRQQSKRIHRND